ncbi:MAG: hypothetical protein R3F39_13385 [Myxococcota bacterium]
MKQNNSLDLRVQRPDGVVVHFPAVSVLLSWVRAGHVVADDLICMRNRPWERLGDTEYGVITRRAPTQRPAVALCEEVEAEIQHPANLDAYLAAAESVSDYEEVASEYESARA